MRKPKLYRAMWIEFESLRNGIGDNLGVIFDVDTMVKRKCRRVLAADGWKWQIINLHAIGKWDDFVDTDQDCLDEIGEDLTEINNAIEEIV